MYLLPFLGLFNGFEPSPVFYALQQQMHFKDCKIFQQPPFQSDVRKEMA